MKKIFITAFALGMLMNAKAQLYIQGGVNFANITKTSTGQTEDNNILTTFNAGILGRLVSQKLLILKAGSYLQAGAPRQKPILQPAALPITM